MSSTGTVGAALGRVSAGFKAVAVLGLGVTMLGAHHRGQRTPEAPAVPAASLTIAQIHRGAGDSAATRTGWTPGRSFRLVAADQWGRFAALDSAEQQAVLKLNRVDRAHARRRNLVVPDSVQEELAYAPFPPTVPALATTPKFITVSRRVQAFGAYEYGRLVRWGPTSTGKAATPTDSGLFFTNWKARTAISTDDPSWILDWYVNIIALKGVAFHQYDLPGRPASHGCVRLMEVDARWIYGWADQWVPGRGSQVKRYGTPVLIFGDYAYDQPAPWLGLVAGDPSAVVSAEELTGALGPNLTTIAARAAPATDSVRWRSFLALNSMPSRRGS